MVAEGRPGQLRAQVGGDVVELTVEVAADLAAAVRVLQAVATGSVKPAAEGNTLRVPVRDADALPDVVRLMDGAHLRFHGLALHEPTLDDVFLTLTGRRDEPSPAPLGSP